MGRLVRGWSLNCAYLLLLLVMSPVFIWKSWRLGKYRHGWGEKLLGRVSVNRATEHRPRIWLHAVSVGEVLQLRVLLEQLRQQLPHAELVVSTTTATGYDVAREKLPADHVCYFPLDFTWAVREALDRIQPTLIVLVELELWPNLLAAAAERQIPVAVINGRLSQRSWRGYRRIRWLLAPLLRKLALVAVQSEEYRDRFLDLGTAPDRCVVTGSIKFDGVRSNKQDPAVAQLAEFFEIRPGEKVFIAGSTQDPEEALALEVYQALRPEFPQLRLIVVPRHPERGDEIARQIITAGYRVIRRSGRGNPEILRTVSAITETGPAVGLLDTVGELGACWGLASVAFVGGSFGNRGGQNMLEPAGYGAAVCFGPNTRNFRQIVELLLAAEAATVVSDGAALREFVRQMLTNPAMAAAQGERAQELVRAHQGATRRSLQLLLGLIPTRSAAPTA